MEDISERLYIALNSPITWEMAEESLEQQGHSSVTYGQITKRLCQMQLAYADAMLTEMSLGKRYDCSIGSLNKK